MARLLPLASSRGRSVPRGVPGPVLAGIGCLGELRLRLPSLRHRGARFVLQFTYHIEPLGMGHCPPCLGRLAPFTVAMVMPLCLALPR